VSEDNDDDDYNSLEDFADMCDDAVAGWDSDEDDNSSSGEDV
jgi:hypothetical protein